MPQRSTRLAVFAATVATGLIGVLASGCRLHGRDEYPDDGDDDGEELTTAEQELVDDGNEVEGTVRGDSGLALLPTFAFIGRKDPLTLSRAVQFQSFVPRAFLPSGCATVETVGNVVTYSFDACRGPLGLVEISGQQVVTFRPGPAVGSIEMTMASEGLTLGGRAVEHDAVAVLTIAEGSRELTYEGTFTGTTPRGIAVSHASDLTIRTDEDSACATIDGTTGATVGVRGVDVTFDQLTRCGPATSCPSGSITSTARLRDLSVTVAFDGSETAVVTTPRGREIDVDLACEPR